MQQRPAGASDREAWMVERAVVLQILSDDHEGRWSRAALAGEMSDCAPAALDRALLSLERDGVLCRDGGDIAAARATRRLDELELIGV
ncbi:MAG TPA: hypothetical protein VK756_11550 [Solirubrobacteraceae bacterium]|jgi:hypothetical protein|nr:hypothetical protein [Solirubrobacteraceae bacterium]